MTSIATKLIGPLLRSAYQLQPSLTIQESICGFKPRIFARKLSSADQRSVDDLSNHNEGPILYEIGTNHVRYITLNRPSKRNAVNIEMVQYLKHYLQIFDEDEDASVAVISGRGGNFCSGYDLNELVNIEDGQSNISNLDKMLLPTTGKLSRHKIVIAAMEGYAAGFGFELALRCDIRVAENDAMMGFLNRRFGIPIVNGGTVLLPKLINGSTAMELILTGRALQATEAVQMGLIKQRCDIGCCLGTATNLARSLTKFDQATLVNDKNSTFNAIMHPDDNGELSRKFFEERIKGLDQFTNTLPLDVAVRFLKGDACRHGKFNLQNKVEQMPVCTV